VVNISNLPIHTPSIVTLLNRDKTIQTMVEGVQAFRTVESNA
jgi:hypothetical protein